MPSRTEEELRGRAHRRISRMHLKTVAPHRVRVLRTHSRGAKTAAPTTEAMFHVPVPQQISRTPLKTEVQRRVRAVR